MKSSGNAAHMTSSMEIELFGFFFTPHLLSPIYSNGSSRLIDARTNGPASVTIISVAILLTCPHGCGQNQTQAAQEFKR